MSDKLFALITLTITSLFGLLVAIVTNKLTARREDRILKRQLDQERLDAIRALYEDALFALDRLIIQYGMGDKAEQDEITRLMARLSLRSTNEIQAQFEQTVESARAWASEYRKSLPEDHGSYKIVKSVGVDYEKIAETLYPKVHDALSKLKVMMNQHLTNLENNVK